MAAITLKHLLRANLSQR